METLMSSSSVLVVRMPKGISTKGVTVTSDTHHCQRNRKRFSIGTRKFPARIRAINDVSTAADPAQAVVTWQIVVGTIAGVTPFVVAGIEFSKRIVAQRRCQFCGGSGLVLRGKYYFRCPGCGFLPWQSWKRFFSG
uniref:Viral late gene transcription factor 3 zinc ribbon domain-containing protein n=1 Tax=Nelumbo nucifera TaxID=4432 RepID=A0A822XPR7_NELNU|nr:TPA_asm: hypothetical protein HUJ06_025067 [Nelumbo nucifera]